MLRDSLEQDRTARLWAVTQVTGRLGAGGLFKFEASLDYRVRPFLLKNKTKQTITTAEQNRNKNKQNKVKLSALAE